MNKEEYKEASNFWKNKEVKTMPKDELKMKVEEYLSNDSVCALATGFGDYVRCTPLEYSFFDGKFYIFTEGGEKFVGLKNNKNVSLAVFDKKPGFKDLKSVQVSGIAKIVENMSDEYLKAAEYKKIPVAALEKLLENNHPMHLICITPIKMDILFSSFKEEGYDARETLEYWTYDGTWNDCK